MNNTKIALIGSATLPPGVLLPESSAGSRVEALAHPSQQAGQGVRLVPGSFLDDGKIDAVVRGARLVVYAPRSWRAWIPAWFDRALRYTLLAAGWAGTSALVVVPPPPAPHGMLSAASEWLRRRIVQRVLRTLEGNHIEWRIMDVQEAGTAPALLQNLAAVGDRARDPQRSRPSVRPDSLRSM
jgi:hypothetical protein